MSDKSYRPTLSTTHIHNVRAVTVQRDLKNGCIDIVLHGSEDYLTARISVWPHGYDGIPTVGMLEDAKKEEEPVE